MDAATIDSRSVDPPTVTLLRLVTDLTRDPEHDCEVADTVLNLVAARRVRLVGQIVAADLGL